MLKTMGLSDTLSAFGDGRQHAEPAQLSLQMDGDRRSDISSKAGKYRLPLTPAAYLTLPVVFLVVSILSLDFARLSHYVVTIWPTDALILAALLRCERSLRNYASILLG